MSTEKLSLFLSAVQTAVVALSLFGVVWQLKQFNRNMRNDAYSKVVEDYCRISQTIIDKPQLNKLFYADNPGVTALDPVQQDFYNYIALFFGVVERAYILYSRGWIDKENWMAWERWMTQHWFRLPLFEKFWAAERTFYTQKFYNYVDRMYKAFNESRPTEGAS